jgi:hypothetical protein
MSFIGECRTASGLRKIADFVIDAVEHLDFVVAETLSVTFVPQFRLLVSRSHCGGPDWIPVKEKWDLWLTKWHWDRFTPNTGTWASLANFQSIYYFIMIIIMHHPGLVQ